MIMGVASDLNLQATLAASNPPAYPLPAPHHPISCRAELLWLEEDGRMGCEHGHVPAGDQCTQGAINGSVAILLIEILQQREDGNVPG